MDVGGANAPRVEGTQGGAREAAAQWRRAHPAAFEALCAALEPFDVAVNAAGAATPGVPASRGLFEANAVLPAVVAQAAAGAGVRRLVHLSTASVQGRLDPLDETLLTCPLSPYAVSKTQGEAVLARTDARRERPAEVVIYRPTAIQGADRATTRSLGRMAASLPVVPLAGRGDRPAPVSLLENVAAGVLFAATMPEPPPVVLQPWEGLTTRRLLEIFGARRIVPLPERMVDLVLRAAGRATARSAAATAALRRVELVVAGQAVNADALARAGFVAPCGVERWEALARELRGGEVAPAAGPSLPAADPAA